MSPRTPTLPPAVTAHVDGACHPNPGLGGWGVVLRSGEREKRMKGRVPEERTSNQRAEITAAIQALAALNTPCKVRVVSDSQYLVQTMLGNYKRRSNLDLWEALDAAAERHEVAWEWVRGHTGDRGNGIAHKLAERAVGEADAVASPTPPAPPELCPGRVDDGEHYACGRVSSHRGVLLDWCALGVVMNVAGCRCVIPWKRVGLVELSA